MLTPPRSPDDELRLRPSDALAGYPTLSAFAASRRRFLKLCALSSAAVTLGLPLVGCPGDPQQGSGGGGGSGGEWVPWDDTQRLAGEPMMIQIAPVGVVAGGGPVAVTFKDGAQADLVVAVVVVVEEGVHVQGEFGRLADTHAAAIQAEAAKVDRAVLADVVQLEAFEAALFAAIAASVQVGSLQEVSVAEARADEPARAPARREAPAREEEAREAVQEPAPPQEAAPAGDAPAAPPRPTLAAKQLYVPCRTPGCSNCGAP